MPRNYSYILFILVLLFAPQALLAQGKQTVRIVSGKSVTLTAHSNNHIGFLWFKNGEEIIESDTASIKVFEDGLYTVIALGTFCNSDMSDPVEVIIMPDLPEEKVDLKILNQADRESILVGKSMDYQILIQNKNLNTAYQVEIEINLPKEIKLLDILQPQEGTIERLNNNSIIWRLDSLEGNKQLSLQLSVIAETIGNAESIAKISSKQEDSFIFDNEDIHNLVIFGLHIPNVFTPNNDGINDVFEIKGLEHLSNNKITIFNVNGNEVYKSNSYKNDWNGGGLNTGTYYYVLEIQMPNGQWELFKGYVMILR